MHFCSNFLRQENPVCLFSSYYIYFLYTTSPTMQKKTYQNGQYFNGSSTMQYMHTIFVVVLLNNNEHPIKNYVLVQFLHFTQNIATLIGINILNIILYKVLLSNGSYMYNCIWILIVKKIYLFFCINHI